MKKVKFIDEYFELLSQQISSINNKLLMDVAKYIELINTNNGKIIVVGNGEVQQ